MYNTIAHEDSITIRLAGPEDADGLRRLAERDSSELPAGELLVALVGHDLRAATAIRTGAAVADPFHPTRELVSLLAERAEQMRGGRATGLLDRLRRRGSGHRGLSPQPAGTLRAFD